jgi:hypothetical protein
MQCVRLIPQGGLIMMNEDSSKTETNTTDGTVGQRLRDRVAARKAELEAAIASPTTDERTRSDLQSALGQVEGMLTGNLDQIPRVVAANLSAWLEANKHLDEHHPEAEALALVDASGSVTQPVVEHDECCHIDEPPATPLL